MIDTIERLEIVGQLYLASTESMMQRMLDGNAEIDLLKKRLDGNLDEVTALCDAAKKVVLRQSGSHLRHPHEMELVTAMYLLEGTVPGLARELAEDVVAMDSPALGWANRYAKLTLKNPLYLEVSSTGDDRISLLDATSYHTTAGVPPSDFQHGTLDVN